MRFDPVCTELCRVPYLIADQKAWHLIPGESFRQLLRDPFRRRVRGYIEPDKLPPSQPDNDQNVELDKADGRNHEQIHGRHMRRMIAQKRAPALTRRIASLGLVLADARLRHHKAELEQFAMNVWCTPKPIVHAHPPSTPAIPQRFAAGLPGSGISSASNGEVQRDASARRSPAAGLSSP